MALGFGVEGRHRGLLVGSGHALARAGLASSGDRGGAWAGGCGLVPGDRRMLQPQEGGAWRVVEGLCCLVAVARGLGRAGRREVGAFGLAALRRLAWRWLTWWDERTTVR